MVATRTIKKGEVVLFEAPEGLVKAGEVPDNAPAQVTTEWLLTRVLVEQGKGQGQASRQS